MRDFSLLLFLFSLWSCSLANDEFHVHSLKHVQKRHDIPLEFIMNSQEHSDIRRSVRVEKNMQRLSSDKFLIRRHDVAPVPEPAPSDSTEVVGEPESVPDKFDQPSYDFMIPEGRSENSTILAVVDFITRKHNVKPTFIVNFDDNQWFDVGNVEKTTADNADVYKATVVLRAGADVSIVKTDGGVYKFVVEAQQGDVVLATTNISVDVLSLAPTTKRVRVTEHAEVEDTTADSSTVSEEMLELGGVFGASSDDDLTTTEVPRSTLAAEEAVNEKEEEEEVEVFETESSGDNVSPTITTTTTLEPHLDDLEGSGALLSFTSSPEEIKEQEEQENLSSAELLTPNSPEEAPIDGPITILPLLASEEGKIEPIDAQIQLLGAQESSPIFIPANSNHGDVIRNLSIVLNSSNLSSPINAELSIEPKGILSIRPIRVKVNEQAMLFIDTIEPLRTSDKKLEIIANFSGAIIRHPITVQFARDTEEMMGSEMVSLREIELGVVETAESGRTIGSVDGDMKILGGQNSQLFSLVGNDIILTCGQFSTDKCLQDNTQKTFTLMLMPQNGTFAPLQVTIRVLQTPSLRTSDKVVRISDNRIISPFAVITERTTKNIKLDGSAAKFLGFVKAQDGLYQLIVANSAPSGRYTLEISLEDLDNSPMHSVDVFVENSLSHAHFRKPKYSVDIDVNNAKEDLKLTQVELEGVPIDEAKIMVLDGNPGWVTVEDYGGKVKVGKYDGPMYNGVYPIRIGAVDKKTWTILTETLVELHVTNGEEKEALEATESNSLSIVLEKTFDREKTKEFHVELDNSKGQLKLDPKSVFGVDEMGKRVAVEPTSITVTKSSLQLSPSSLKIHRLRILTFTLLSLSHPLPTQKISVLIRLISSPEYLETVRRNAARPVYPEPWSRHQNVISVEMNEELAPGQVVGVFPAVSPVADNLKSIQKIKLEGDMKDAFLFDEQTGELKVNQRIDFESLSENQKTFDLTLTSGEKNFESVAILRVKVLDVDDNSPVINTGNAEVVFLTENLPPGSKIAEFDVTDPDGSASYQVKFSGPGSENYRANITELGTLSLYTADNAQIDREAQDSQSLLIEVSDVSNNTDRAILPIRILDVNDNAPEFTRKMYDVQVVEDWPRGVVIEKVHATDADVGKAAQVRYSIRGPSDVVAVNETSGVVTVAGELWGMARDAPYKFELVARDSGEPELNSSAILSLRIRGKGEVMTETSVVFLEPKNGVQIVVKENLPLDTKIYTAKAEQRGIASQTRGILTYSLKDLTGDEKEPNFAIDKESGDIFAVKNIDYEKNNEYTLLITATNSEDESLSSSAILKIHVENLDDNEPRFLQSANPVFLISRNVSSPTAVGRITAYDPDSMPIFYHILPTCGSEMAANFTIDPEFGEVIYHPKTKINDKTDFELCFLATAEKEKDVSEVFFDGTARNMRKVMVHFVDDEKAEMKDQRVLNSMRITGNQSISQVGDVLDRIEIPISLNENPTVEYSLDQLEFVPANYELGRDVISPEGSVELNKKTGEVVANGRILDTPQGVYTAKISRGEGNAAVKQLHHIRNDRKLRYVLAMSRNEFGANSDKLRRQILEAVGDGEKTGKQLDVYFDEPTMDKKNSTWTSVCFYLTRDNAILDDKQMTSLVSGSNGHIAKLHHIFKVVNVDSCAPKSSASSPSTGSTPSEIPINTLILIGVVGLLIIALVALLVFVCCVSRYQRYLKQKMNRMRGSSSAGSYYKSPNLIPPPPPGYMHTPPLPPPPPPAAIAYY